METLRVYFYNYSTIFFALKSHIAMPKAIIQSVKRIITVIIGAILDMPV